MILNTRTQSQLTNGYTMTTTNQTKTTKTAKQTKTSKIMATATKTTSNANTIQYITVNNIDQFSYNPYNPRDKNASLIELVSVPEETDQPGVITTSHVFNLISDEKLKDLGVNVSDSYRKAFNELVSSLITYAEDDSEIVTIEILNPLRVTPLDAVEKGFYTVLSGNTRLHIVNQVLTRYGADKVRLIMPFVVVDNYTGVADLLSSGLRDNTGIPLESTAQWDVLNNAYLAASNLFPDLDSRLGWVRDAVTYGSNSVASGNNRIPSAIMSKWAITVKEPNFTATFGKYVNRNFLSRLFNLLTSFPGIDINQDDVRLGVELIISEFLGTIEKQSVATEKTYTELAKFLRNKYNPEIQTTQEPQPVPNKENDSDNDDLDNDDLDSDDLENDDELEDGENVDNKTKTDLKKNKIKHQIGVSVRSLNTTKEIIKNLEDANLDEYNDVKKLIELNKLLLKFIKLTETIKEYLPGGNTESQQESPQEIQEKTETTQG